MSSPLQNNITNLQNLLEQVNALPEAITLPELTNEGVADDLVTGRELIDANGNVITGTNPYEKSATDIEVATQTELLTQAVAALEGKVGGAGNTGSVMQIATGTFTPSITSINEKQITIGGLGFTPKSLIVHINITDNYTHYLSAGVYSLLSLNIGELFDYSVSVLNNKSMIIGLNNANEYYSVQFTQDGFVLSLLDDSYSMSSTSHIYHAFG